ncbi:uncharacterized protein [Apostichopus japonicus]|uniref:uncharacterized protein n=1 Tax=Stichopus japonicus TaxID=307972 RepID=UPI003AB25F4F
MPSTTRPVSQNRISSDVTTGPLTELYEEVETPNNKSLKLGLGVGISLFAVFVIVAVFLLLKRWRNRRSISRKDNGKNLHTKIYLGKSPKTGVSDTDGRMSLQTRDYATLNFPEDQRVSSRHPDSFYQLLESDTDRLPMVAVNNSHHNEMSRDEEYDKLVRQGDPSLINNVNKQTDLDYQATRPKHNNGYDHVERIFPSQAIEISDHEYSVATNPTPTTDQSYDHLDRQVTARSTKDDMVVSSSTYDVLESVNDDRTKQDIQSLNKSQINDPHQYETTLIKQIGNVNG